MYPHFAPSSISAKYDCRKISETSLLEACHKCVGVCSPYAIPVWLIDQTLVEEILCVLDSFDIGRAISEMSSWKRSSTWRTGGLWGSLDVAFSFARIIATFS